MRCFVFSSSASRLQRSSRKKRKSLRHNALVPNNFFSHWHSPPYVLYSLSGFTGFSLIMSMNLLEFAVLDNRSELQGVKIVKKRIGVMDFGRNANRTFSLLLAASMLFSGGVFQPSVSACSSQSCDQDCCCSSRNRDQEAASGCCSRTNTTSRRCCHRAAEKSGKATSCCQASKQSGKDCQCQCRQHSPIPIRPERDDTARRQFEQLLAQQLSFTSLDIPLADDSDACDVSEHLTADSAPSAQARLCVWLT